MNLQEEFERQVRSTITRLGIESDANLAEVRAYAAGRMLHLASIIEEPGYQEALLDEALSVATMAAGSAVATADALDRELVGQVFGLLAMGARAIA